jgi:hypothetical protein
MIKGYFKLYPLVSLSNSVKIKNKVTAMMGKRVKSAPNLYLFLNK